MYYPCTVLKVADRDHNISLIPYLVESHMFHDVNHVLIELSADMSVKMWSKLFNNLSPSVSAMNVFPLREVSEDERLLHVETQGDDVLGILYGQPLGFLQFEVFPQELFIVGQLDDQRYVEGFLIGKSNVTKVCDTRTCAWPAGCCYEHLTQYVLPVTI
jgi:hypothetical protein